MTISISGITSLGKVTSENIVVDNRLLNIPMPTASSDRAVVSSLLGKTRKITISGIFYGTDAQIKAFITAVEAWVNVNGLYKFQEGRTYTDSFSSSYTVLANDFDWTRSTDSPRSIEYTIDMIEGQNIETWIGGWFD